MLEHDSEQRAAAPAEKRGQEPVDKPANGSGVGPAAQTAADGGEALDIPMEVVDAIEAEVEPPVSRPSIMTRLALTAHEADRFAASFRPSWAPLEPEPVAPAATSLPAVATMRGSFKPVVARDWDGSPILREDRDPEEKEDNVRASIAGPRRRALRRAGVLAALSIASFLALTYWGISNTTHPAAAPAPHATQQQARAKEDAPAPPSEAMAPSQPAAPVVMRREPRLADPDNPEPAAQVQQAEPAQEPEATATAVAPEEPAAEPTAAEPAAETARPTAEPSAPAAQETTTHPALAAEPAAPPPSAAKPAEPPPAPTAVTAAAKPAELAATAAPPAVKPPQPSAAAAEPKKAPAEAHAQAPLLVVRALPEDAHLWLDGQRMANPFDVRLPRGYKHKIEARAPGYEDSSQTVHIESDAKLTISLRRATPSPEPRVQVKPLARAQGAGFVTTNPY